MHSFHGPEDHGSPPGRSAEVDPAERLDAVADELLANQTPRQRELAQQIWDRLSAGDEVDDIRDLIADLSRTATEDAKRRGEVPRTGGIQ